MRLAIISDVHWGDESCHLDLSTRKRAVRVNKRRIEKAYELLLGKIGPTRDYLIILGDGLDFSVCNYDQTYAVAKAFFQRIKADGVADRIIYVPGNHDADLWHICEHDVNVVKRLASGRLPRGFRYSVPGVIDGRTQPGDPIFQLIGASKDKEESLWGYESLFLNKITTDDRDEGPSPEQEIRIALAYPNLYLLTDNGSVMMTHGQYFEVYWSILAQIVLDLAREEIRVLLQNGVLPLSDFVAFNFPLNQLACTGIGQAGSLTDRVIRRVQDEVKGGNTQRAEKYLDRLDNFVDRLIDRGPFVEIFTDFASNVAKRQLRNALKNIKPARGNPEFIYQPGVMERFKTFYASTLLEFDTVFPPAQNPNLKHPDLLIFGHTHDPVGFSGEEPQEVAPLHDREGRIIRYANTGGWLYHRDKKYNTDKFCGARVVTFDSATQKLESQLIAEEDISGT